MLAAHAPQALALLADASPEERRTLGAIGYQANEAVLHTDAGLLPRRRAAWAAWNYERDVATGTTAQNVCLHYLLNQLQPLPWRQPVIVSLNPLHEPREGSVLRRIAYAHPGVDSAAVVAPEQLASLQGLSHDVVLRRLDPLRLPRGRAEVGPAGGRPDPGAPGSVHRHAARHRRRRRSGIARGRVMTAPAAPLRARIGFGEVRHRRVAPVAHAFAYPTCFLMLPMRSLRRQADAVLARNRRALFGFRDADHGDGRADSLAWLDAVLAGEGIADADGEVWLHCIPRMFGFAFKPVSFWYAHRADGALAAIVVEVNNTFGERHCYLLAGAGVDFGRTLSATKVFHVSPFCQTRGEYAFRFMVRTASSRRATTAAAPPPMLMSSCTWTARRCCSPASPGRVEPLIPRRGAVRAVDAAGDERRRAVAHASTGTR